VEYTVGILQSMTGNVHSRRRSERGIYDLV